MVYAEGSISGEMDPMIFFYSYEFDENNNLFYYTMYYGIRCKDDGTVVFTGSYHFSPDLTDQGFVSYRTYQKYPLNWWGIVSTLESDLKDHRLGSVPRYLIASDPYGHTTVFAPEEAPTLSHEKVTEVSELTIRQIVEQGLSAFYEQYGPRKKD